MAVKIVDASALTACCSTSRKRQPSPTDGRTEVSWRPLCWASIAEVDHADTLRLAEAFGLSSYDAAYLWLAQKLAAELVTLDQRLQTAGMARD
jgi:hypothetical protein